MELENNRDGKREKDGGGKEEEEEAGRNGGERKEEMLCSMTMKNTGRRTGDKSEGNKREGEPGHSIICASEEGQRSLSVSL